MILILIINSIDYVNQSKYLQNFINKKYMTKVFHTNEWTETNNAAFSNFKRILFDKSLKFISFDRYASQVLGRKAVQCPIKKIIVAFECRIVPILVKLKRVIK